MKVLWFGYMEEVVCNGDDMLIDGVSPDECLGGGIAVIIRPMAAVSPS